MTVGDPSHDPMTAGFQSQDPVTVGDQSGSAEYLGHQKLDHRSPKMFRFSATFAHMSH